MNETINIVRLRQPDEFDDPLTDVLRSGARRLLAQAIEMEAETFLAEMRDVKLPDGRERLVRHGHGPERNIQTGHKTANVLNKVPLSVQANMKTDLREIYGAPTRAAAETAIDVFAQKYGAKYDKAVDCLMKDRGTLLAFYDFPAEHWDHLRTSNPIESVFATVRHRTVRTKGSLSSNTARLMVFKLVMAAAKSWRRLKGQNQLPKLLAGVRFQDGIEVIEMKPQSAA